MKKISIIVAASENNVIGNAGKLPWDIPSDLKYFKKLTTGNVIIMGRKTYESIGRPLPNRINVIITRNKDYKAEGCIIKSSLIEATKSFEDGEIFIIGGGEIYKEALYMADRLYLTRVSGEFAGDTYLDDDFLEEWFLEESSDIQEENGFKFKFLVYE